MQLIEVHIVRLQAAQRAFDGSANVGPVECRRTVANPGQAARRSGHLGGENNLVALLVLQPVTDDGFSGTIGFRTWRNGVHLGGVDEIDTL